MADESLDEKEKRKAEVRARLEQAAAQKKKKGFMTPARKKRLRGMIRALAAEELKKEAERKAEERRKVIAERTGAPKDLESMNEAELQQIIKQYYDRVYALEGDKYDLEYNESKKNFEIREIRAKVSYVRGKFAKPPLKKVSNMARQMERIRLMTAKASNMNFGGGLKEVKKVKQEEEKEEKSELQKKLDGEE